ncbi:hypothetical protein M407DRAFT_81941, partial [Tulasnella calospora MUT 4182]
RLNHPNIIKLVGVVEDMKKGIVWLVYPWEANGNLVNCINGHVVRERRRGINDVAMGLSYLHGRDPPICHGDLKSLNILVNSGNRAVITDFGSARTALTAEIAPSGEFITITGPAWTMRWAAPELLEGDLPGLASDIWALGWICWEVVTGKFPFDKENDVSVVLRITKGDLPAIENDDQLKQIKVLCNLMRECWKLDTSERPTALRCQQIISLMVLYFFSGRQPALTNGFRRIRQYRGRWLLATRGFLATGAQHSPMTQGRHILPPQICSRIL